MAFAHESARAVCLLTVSFLVQSFDRICLVLLTRLGLGIVILVQCGHLVSLFSSRAQCSARGQPHLPAVYGEAPLAGVGGRLGVPVQPVWVLCPTARVMLCFQTSGQMCHRQCYMGSKNFNSQR